MAEQTGRIEEFRISERRVRILKSSAFVVGMALVLGTYLLVAAILKGSYDYFFLVVGTGVVVYGAFVVVPRDLPKMVIRFEGKALSVSTPLGEEHIVLDAVDKLRRTLDGSGKTLAIKLTAAGKRTRLAGLQDMDRLYESISRSLAPTTAVVEVVHKRAERWLTRGAYWILLLMMVMYLGCYAIALAAGTEALLLVLSVGAAPGGLVCILVERKFAPWARGSLCISIAGLVLYIGALAVFWFYFRPLAKRLGVYPLALFIVLCCFPIGGIT